MSAAAAAGPACSDFPGAPAPYTDVLKLTVPSERIPVYRVMNDQGKIIAPGYTLKHDDETLKKWYKLMIKLNVMDSIFYDAQRQGRISFYMTSFGEEAIHFGSASALDSEDVIFAQYREAGVLMYRGFSLNNFAHQCFSTHKDLGKGRQMPVHYGSKALNFQTISSPLATQLPQASGAAYALKRAGKNNIVTCYFGEGAASEGDFHPAMNFAVTLKCPVLFFCRNNGFAISTPTKDQYGGDGIAARAAGYGMRAIRVDGNDILAVHEATAAARAHILATHEPVLLEAMSYRAGHHSTSDDSTRYRSVDDILKWQSTNNPMTRLRLLLQSRGVWDEVQEAETRQALRVEVLEALNEAEMSKKPPVSQMFEDVYAELPHHLRDQEAEWRAFLTKHADKYHLGDEFIADSEYDNPAKH